MGRSQEREWLDEALAGCGERPATDDDWHNFGDGIAGESDAEIYARVIHETRQGARGQRRVRKSEPKASATDGPNDESSDGEAWDAYRRRLFVEEAGTAACYVRGLFGLRGPVEPEELPALLARAREVERREGDELRLEVPAVQGDRIVIAEEWTVFAGSAADEHGWRWALQPLGELAFSAAGMAKRLGVGQADAVLFLLCDLVPYWPPARAFVERGPRFAVVVRIEWPFEDPQTVADLFTRVRGSLYGLPADADVEDRRTVGRRVMSAELVHFAAERRERGQTWKQVHAAWERTYPDKHFETELSLRRTYLEADKRLPDMIVAPAPWRPRVD
ncbi:MAG: hypothetical protein BWY94_01924 [Actinobacteria bacterium ADurb.BinA094]|nr:MAG: hypothetical protein BWY94_01924 [Actinobacteria bacterium ADurb.BinA094]